MKSYVSKIQELEGELLRLQNLNGSKVVDCLELDDDALHSRDTYFTNLHELSSGSGTKDVDINGKSKSYEFPIFCMVHDLDSSCSLSFPLLSALNWLIGPKIRTHFWSWYILYCIKAIVPIDGISSPPPPPRISLALEGNRKLAAYTCR